MRYAMVTALLLVLSPATMMAQGVPGPRAQILRERIERRFAQRVQTELRLSDEQASRLRETTSDFAGRRRALQQRERSARLTLATELRRDQPNQERIDRLTEELLDLRVEQAQLLRGEMDALGEFLSPDQRARFFALRELLRRRTEELRERRPGARR